MTRSVSSCADPGIFFRGVQINLTKKSSDNVFFFFFFLVLSLFFRSQMVNFIFQGSTGGPTFSRGGGGSNFFEGGGSNCLFPIETHITCDFPGGGGSGPPVPPLDPHLQFSMPAHYLCVQNADNTSDCT